MVTTQKVIISKQSIASLVEMLPKDAFVRVHRSYIIAINKVDSYNSDAIGIGKTEIPIGRLFRHDVTRVLNIAPLKSGIMKQSIVTKNNLDNEHQKKDS